MTSALPVFIRCIQISLVLNVRGKKLHAHRASLVAQLVRNLPVMQETTCSSEDPKLGRSPGEGNGNPLQYACLGNPMDRGAWQTTVHRVAGVGHDLATKLPTTYTHTYTYIHVF